MQENILKAEVRTQTGKGAARKMRASGMIPAVVYGENIEPMSLSVSNYDFSRMISKSSSTSMLIDLTIGNDEPRKVIIREIQTDPISSRIDCIDFKQISMDKEITLSMPITLSGTPEGVKNQGGIMEFLHREVEISCLPGNIPEKIILDVSQLKIGDTLHYEDIEIENAAVISNPRISVVTVVAPTVVKEKAAGAEGEEGAEVAEAAGDQKEPEVIREKKDKEKEED